MCHIVRVAYSNAPRRLAANVCSTLRCLQWNSVPQAGFYVSQPKRTTLRLGSKRSSGLPHDSITLFVPNRPLERRSQGSGPDRVCPIAPAVPLDFISRVLTPFGFPLYRTAPLTEPAFYISTTMAGFFNAHMSLPHLCQLHEGRGLTLFARCRDTQTNRTNLYKAHEHRSIVRDSLGSITFGLVHKLPGPFSLQFNEDHPSVPRLSHWWFPSSARHRFSAASSDRGVERGHSLITWSAFSVGVMEHLWRNLDGYAT